MASDWKKYKPLLKYHRIFVLSIVFSYILIKYAGAGNNDTYDNGQLKYEGRHEGGFNEGRWIWYYPNGKKQMEGTFKHNKRIGKWSTWNNSEILITERNYEDDKLNGAFRDWYDNGNRKGEGNYINDQLHGEIKMYKEDGTILSIEQFNNGIKIK